jgi:hypothetical protein
VDGGPRRRARRGGEDRCASAVPSPHLERGDGALRLRPPRPTVRHGDPRLDRMHAGAGLRHHPERRRGGGPSPRLPAEGRRQALAQGDRDDRGRREGCRGAGTRLGKAGLGRDVGPPRQVPHADAAGAMGLGDGDLALAAAGHGRRHVPRPRRRPLRGHRRARAREGARARLALGDGLSGLPRGGRRPGREPPSVRDAASPTTSTCSTRIQ